MLAEKGSNKKPAVDPAAQQARQRMQKMFAAAAGSSRWPRHLPGLPVSLTGCQACICLWLDYKPLLCPYSHPKQLAGCIGLIGFPLSVAEAHAALLLI